MKTKTSETKTAIRQNKKSPARFMRTTWMRVIAIGDVHVNSMPNQRMAIVTW